MIKVFILITPEEKRERLSNDLQITKFKPTARDPQLINTFNALELSYKNS